MATEDLAIAAEVKTSLSLDTLEKPQLTNPYIPGGGIRRCTSSFNVEGVPVQGVEPLHGTLLFDNECAWLRPNGIPRWSEHEPDRHALAELRLDDGDIKTSDALNLKVNRLLRTVNVVTDELHVDRQIIAYERQNP